jgi:hypothetical protein
LYIEHIKIHFERANIKIIAGANVKSITSLFHVIRIQLSFHLHDKLTATLGSTKGYIHPTPWHDIQSRAGSQQDKTSYTYRVFVALPNTQSFPKIILLKI